MGKILAIVNLFVQKYPTHFLFSVLCMYVFTAYKSSGFHHPDEHYQVIEFAMYKLGETKASELTWEFDAEIRSTLQPTFSFLIIKGLRVLEVTDPYTISFVLRLITALLAVYVLNKYSSVQSTKIAINFQGLFVFLTFCFWVVPYSSVRFSSETWSGLFFLLALVQLQRSIRYRFVFVGLLVGLAVLLRYQAAIMLVGLLAWLLVSEKVGLRSVGQLMVGVLLVILVGFVVDSWFYGRMTFSIYNYFRVNIIDDVASTFGTAPIYAYFVYILEQLGYPIGMMMILSLIYMFLYRWREKEVWIIVPFILVHSLIPHKEPRFLLPIAFYSGYVWICFIQYLYGLRNKELKKLGSIALAIVLVSNGLGLLIVCSKAAGNGTNAIGSFINTKYKGQKVNVIYLVPLDKYQDWPYMRNTFYKNEQLTFKRLVTIWQEDFNDALDTTAINLLMLSRLDITGPRSEKKMADLGFKPVFQSIPAITQLLIDIYDSENNYSLLLYERGGQ